MAAAPEPNTAHPLPGSVVAALLDFEQMPGRYPIARREPALLFDRAGTVLQLASDRAVDGLVLGSATQAQGARRAAQYFVRTVMLRPGSDHYTLLGLTPVSPPETQRDHYRMMIRLTHPDFAAAGEGWPADAASRINFANDVLSSPVQRQLYNASLAPEPALPVAPFKDTLPPKAAPWALGVVGGVSRLLTGRKTTAMCAALLLAGFVWLFSGTDHHGASLMVKRAAPSAALLPTAQAHAPQGMRLLLDTALHEVGPGATPATIRHEDVQPTMDQVLGALRSGRGETVLQVLGSEWHSHPSTMRFVGDFNQWLAGRSVRGVNEVKRSAANAAGLFVVNSSIDFQLQSGSQKDETQRLNLKAVFLAQDGAPVLTQLVAQP